MEEDTPGDLIPVDSTSYSVTLGKNETDSAYVKVDCYPVSMSSDTHTTSAFLMNGSELISEAQSTFQALLDSAYTHHLIQDRCLFWTYRPDQSVKIGTASSGILRTKAQALSISRTCIWSTALCRSLPA